jgi:predicted transglutaminase-like protease
MTTLSVLLFVVIMIIIGFYNHYNRSIMNLHKEHNQRMAIVKDQYEQQRILAQKEHQQKMVELGKELKTREYELKRLEYELKRQSNINTTEPPKNDFASAFFGSLAAGILLLNINNPRPIYTQTRKYSSPENSTNGLGIFVGDIETNVATEQNSTYTEFEYISS